MAQYTTFNKQAEYAGKYLAKGNMIYLEGKIQTRKWDDDKGITHYKTDIVANMLKNLSPKNEDGQGSQPQQNKPQQSSPKPQEVPDDLPF